MFDTMTLTKIVGAGCGALLVFLLGGWAAETLYHTPEVHAEEGEEVHQAYVIPVEEGGSGEEVVEEGPPFVEVFAAADPAAGEGEFRPCSACHALEAGDNRTGPYLYGVVGRAVQAADGYTDYSGALIEVAEVWTPEELNGFLADPGGYAPGTSMNFNGIREVEDRANLIAYLDSLDG